jgi:hypothetical protein
MATGGLSLDGLAAAAAKAAVVGLLDLSGTAQWAAPTTPGKVDGSARPATHLTGSTRTSDHTGSVRRAGNMKATMAAAAKLVGATTTTTINGGDV